MSQSKSILMPFIIIAALVFGGALAWKTFQPEPDVLIIKDTETKTENDITTKNVTQSDEFEIVEYDDTNITPSKIDEELIEKTKKAAPDMMKFAMQFKSKKDILRGLKGYHDLGQNEKFDHLVMYAQRTFPDLEIPTFD